MDDENHVIEHAKDLPRMPPLTERERIHRSMQVMWVAESGRITVQIYVAIRECAGGRWRRHIKVQHGIQNVNRHGSWPAQQESHRAIAFQYNIVNDRRWS